MFTCAVWKKRPDPISFDGYHVDTIPSLDPENLLDMFQTLHPIDQLHHSSAD